MRLTSCFATSAALGGLTLLSSCSKSQPVTRADSSPLKTQESTDLKTYNTSTPGSRADSVNGIPIHHFGDPLSSFPGLVRDKQQPNVGVRYQYADMSKASGWFGKHHKDLLYVNYVFTDGKFAGFSAYANGSGRVALSNEAVQLFGQCSKTGFVASWHGKKVQASYREFVNGGENYEELLISTQELRGEETQAPTGNNRITGMSLRHP